MTEKFTLEDLLIKIVPGGTAIGVLFFVYGDYFDMRLLKGLDFLYSFLFFTFSYIVGEVLQTISHEFEWIVYVFFRLYKPSEIFLYKENPIIKSDRIREELLECLSLSSDELDVFNKKYKELPVLLWKRKKQHLSQSCFWKLYSNVSGDSEIKIFNRGFLFVRSITILSMFLALLFFVRGDDLLFLIGLIVFFLFLWRARGMASTLVFKTVLLNLKDKKD